MRDFHEAIAEENAATLSVLPEAGDIPVRLGISFARFVTASARAHDRSTAMSEDVEETTRFLRLKLEFLRLEVPTIVQEASYEGRAVRPVDFARTHTERTGGEVISERTARRRLLQMGAKRVGKGRYLLPDDPCDDDGD